MHRQFVFTLLALVLCVGLCAGPATAGGRAAGSVPIPASTFTHGTVDSCMNNPGPFIRLEGELTLGGLNGRLIFRNNVKGTHEHAEDITVDVTILDEGETISFAKQPSEGGVGGNPWIYIEFADSLGEPISEELLMGRCVQGLDPVIEDLPLYAMATVDVTTANCRNSGGPYIVLEGEIALGGLNSRLIFRNNQKGTHEHEEYVDVDLVLLPAGEEIRFHKSPSQGGAGGNPHIYFQFTDAEGEPLTGEAYLGRCNQMD